MRTYSPTSPEPAQPRGARRGHRAPRFGESGRPITSRAGCRRQRQRIGRRPRTRPRPRRPGLAENDVVLILFGGEEQGLFGSMQYVEGLTPADRQRIRAVINMDMIGRDNTAAPPCFSKAGGLPARHRRTGRGCCDLDPAVGEPACTRSPATTSRSSMPDCRPCSPSRPTTARIPICTQRATSSTPSIIPGPRDTHDEPGRPRGAPAESSATTAG